MSEVTDLLIGVKMQLIEAVGGPDVPDETLVAPIQADWYRNQAKDIDRVLNLLP
jgi:hypothetical protein